MPERDMEKNPYSADEKRVADFLWERGIGGGNDPIGFLLTSYAYLMELNKALRRIAEKRLAKGGPSEGSTDDPHHESQDRRDGSA